MRFTLQGANQKRKCGVPTTSSTKVATLFEPTSVLGTIVRATAMSASRQSSTQNFYGQTNVGF
jgi:hypothetical protein